MSETKGYVEIPAIKWGPTSGERVKVQSARMGNDIVTACLFDGATGWAGFFNGYEVRVAEPRTQAQARLACEEAYRQEMAARIGG